MGSKNEENSKYVHNPCGRVQAIHPCWGICRMNKTQVVEKWDAKDGCKCNNSDTMSFCSKCTFELVEMHGNVTFL